MFTGCLGLIKSDHIFKLVTKIGFKLEIKMWDSVYKCMCGNIQKVTGLFDEAGSYIFVVLVREGLDVL